MLLLRFSTGHLTALQDFFFLSKRVFFFKIFLTWLESPSTKGTNVQLLKPSEATMLVPLGTKKI